MHHRIPTPKRFFRLRRRPTQTPRRRVSDSPAPCPRCTNVLRVVSSPRAARALADLASENGDFIDLDYKPAFRDSRNGYQVDGYAIDKDRGELFLAVSDFRQTGGLETLDAADLERHFRRAERFFALSLQFQFRFARNGVFFQPQTLFARFQRLFAFTQFRLLGGQRHLVLT